MIPMRHCQECGKLFQPKNNSQKFCKGPHHSICVVCGKRFAPHESNRKNGKVCSAECKAKLNNPKAIDQFTMDGVFIKTWQSARQISKELCVSHSNIIACCKGRQKSSVGYQWRYNNG